MAAQSSSVVEQVVAHCASECFTGLLRVRTSEGNAEIRFLSGIQDSAQFGSLDGEAVVEHLAGTQPLEFQMVPSLPPLDGTTDEVPQQGDLATIDAASLMRYCETNSLTCALALEVGDEILTATYQLGELISLEPDSESAADIAVATEGRYRFRLPAVELPEVARPTAPAPAPREPAVARPPSPASPEATPPAPSPTTPAAARLGGQTAGAPRARPQPSPARRSTALPSPALRSSARPTSPPRSAGQPASPRATGALASSGPGSTAGSPPRPASSSKRPVVAGMPANPDPATRSPQPGAPRGGVPLRSTSRAARPADPGRPASTQPWSPQHGLAGRSTRPATQSPAQATGQEHRSAAGLPAPTPRLGQAAAPTQVSASAPSGAAPTPARASQAAPGSRPMSRPLTVPPRAPARPGAGAPRSATPARADDPTPVRSALAAGAAGRGRIAAEHAPRSPRPVPTASPGDDTRKTDITPRAGFPAERFRPTPTAGAGDRRPNASGTPTPTSKVSLADGRATRGPRPTPTGGMARAEEPATPVRPAQTHRVASAAAPAPQATRPVETTTERRTDAAGTVTPPTQAGYSPGGQATTPEPAPSPPGDTAGGMRPVHWVGIAAAATLLLVVLGLLVRS